MKTNAKKVKINLDKVYLSPYICNTQTDKNNQHKNNMKTQATNTAQQELNVNKVCAYFLAAVTVVSFIVCFITEKLS